MSMVMSFAKKMRAATSKDELNAAWEEAETALSHCWIDEDEFDALDAIAEMVAERLDGEDDYNE